MTIKKLLINYSEKTSKTILDWQKEVEKARNVGEDYFLNYQGTVSGKLINFRQSLIPKLIVDKQEEVLIKKDDFELQNHAVQNLLLFFKENYELSQSEPVSINAYDHLWHIHDSGCSSNDSLWLYQDAVYVLNGIFTNDEKKLLVMEFVDRERRIFEHLDKKFSGKSAQEIQYERLRIPENVRIEVWRRDQGKCVKCGQREYLEYDHIVPISKGGSNTARNIELLCQNCNRAKGNRI